jgi:hypothetical protein
MQQVYYKEEDFRRVSGVKKTTFLRMIDILKKADLIKKKQGGTPNTLSMADRLLMTLESL